MNKFLLFLVLVLMSFYPSSKSEATQNWVIGEQWIEQIEMNYQQGQYKRLLDKIESRYHKDRKADKWNKETSFSLETESFASQLSLLEQAILPLELEKNNQLLDVAQRYPDLLISQVIDKVLNYPAEERAQILNQFHLSLNVDESQTQQADSALIGRLNHLKEKAEIKTKIFFEACGNNEEWTQNFEIENLDQYTLIIWLEMLDKMLEKCLQAGNVEWAERVQLARQAYLQQYSWTHNQMYLFSFAFYRFPQNEAEREVKIIMSKYNQDLQAIIEQLGIGQ